MDGTGVTCNNLGNNLLQSTSQATAAGYTTSQTFAYSPVAFNSPTVGTGQNLTGSCIVNVAALCSSTTYPTYDVVNHKVVMTTTEARPASGAWNIGAYKFAPTGCSITPTSWARSRGGSRRHGNLYLQVAIRVLLQYRGSLTGSGLSLNSGGLLSGTPQAGTFNFTVRYDTATVSLTINIPNAPTSLSAIAQ